MLFFCFPQPPCFNSPVFFESKFLWGCAQTNRIQRRSVIEMNAVSDAESDRWDSPIRFSVENGSHNTVDNLRCVTRISCHIAELALIFFSIFIGLLIILFCGRIGDVVDLVAFVEYLRIRIFFLFNSFFSMSLQVGFSSLPLFFILACFTILLILSVSDELFHFVIVTTGHFNSTAKLENSTRIRNSICLKFYWLVFFFYFDIWVD